MEYIFKYENWRALEFMPPTHGDCADSAKNCTTPVKVVSINIGSGNYRKGGCGQLKKEITALCPECKDIVHFWVVFEK